jgi:hypothetical protein
MNLESLDPEQAEAVALLQPFVDGELSDDEHALVARQIAANPDYQAFVSEQQQVRAALRGLEREAAPPGLRERILADLDAIEAERRRGWLAPVVGRIKAFGHGALLMIPAAAAAAVLFVVASNAGWLDVGPQLDGGHVDAGMANSLHLPARHGERAADGGVAAEPEKAPRAVEPVPAEPEPSLPSAEQFAENQGFAVQVAPPRSLPAGVALVSDSEQAPGSSAMVRYRVGGEATVVDRQRRAGVVELRGTRQAFRGHDYYLARDDQGRPWVEFALGGVHHGLVLEGADARIDAAVNVDESDFRTLLVVADALRQAHGG